MSVQPVSARTYQPNFGNIYMPKNPHFTKQQERTAKQITETLRTPSEIFGNKTPEEYYKKRGVDFRMEGYDRDTIYLEGLEGATKTRAKEEEEQISYINSFKIGVYDENYPFKPEDIKAGYKKDSSKYVALVTTAVLGFIGYILVSIAAITSSPKIPEKSKHFMECVDSITNKAKNVIPDTTKVIKLIR